jgi:uncharacterized protein (UPF0332 family)
MTTWRAMAMESRTTANDLFVARRWRDFASRAYYAVYSQVTHALLAAGVAMPAGRGNPRHKPLPTMVGNHLHMIPLQTRWRLAGVVFKLYTFRIIADYQPNMTFDEKDARICFGLMAQAFLYLKDIP